MKKLISTSIIITILVITTLSLPTAAVNSTQMRSLEITASAQTVNYVTPYITGYGNRLSGTEIYFNKDHRIRYYRVFVWNSTKWKSLGITTESSFIHKGATTGVTYKYAVRGLSDDRRRFLTSYSIYNNTHKRVLPGISQVYLNYQSASNKMSLCMYLDDADENLKYQIFVKDVNNRWRVFKSTYATKFNVPIIEKNGKYYLGNIQLPTPRTERENYNGLLWSDARAWQFTARGLRNGCCVTQYYTQYSQTGIRVVNQ